MSNISAHEVADKLNILQDFFSLSFDLDLESEKIDAQINEEENIVKINDIRDKLMH